MSKKLDDMNAVETEAFANRVMAEQREQLGEMFKDGEEAYLSFLFHLSKGGNEGVADWLIENCDEVELAPRDTLIGQVQTWVKSFAMVTLIKEIQRLRELKELSE